MIATPRSKSAKKMWMAFLALFILAVVIVSVANSGDNRTNSGENRTSEQETIALNPPSWIHGTWRQEEDQTHFWVFGDGTAGESYFRNGERINHLYHNYTATDRVSESVYILTWNASTIYKHTFQRSGDVILLTEEWDGGEVRTLRRYYTSDEIDSGAITAGIVCSDMIERMAKYSHRWTDGFLGSKFTRFNPKQTIDGYARYHGDKVQFQNGFGAWQNMRYWCDVDLDANRAIRVDVTPGRLPP